MKRRRVAGVFLLVASVWAAGARAQNAASPDTLRTQSLDVSDNLYLVSGGGGNSLVMTGDRGVVLVDTKLPGHGRALLDIADSISDQPVTTVIYTHAHADHTGSSRELPTLGQIVAHENTKAIMEQMDAFKGPGARVLPGTDRKSTRLNSSHSRASRMPSSA